MVGASANSTPALVAQSLFCFVAVASAALFALVLGNFILALLFYRRHANSISECEENFSVTKTWIKVKDPLIFTAIPREKFACYQGLGARALIRA